MNNHVLARTIARACASSERPATSTGCICRVLDALTMLPTHRGPGGRIFSRSQVLNHPACATYSRQSIDKALHHVRACGVITNASPGHYHLG